MQGSRIGTHRWFCRFSIARNACRAHPALDQLQQTVQAMCQARWAGGYVKQQLHRDQHGQRAQWPQARLFAQVSLRSYR